MLFVKLAVHPPRFEWALVAAAFHVLVLVVGQALHQMKAASEKRATGVRRRRQINFVVDPADQLEGGEADDTLDLQKAAPKGGGQKRGKGSNAKVRKPAARAQQRPK